MRVNLEEYQLFGMLLQPWESSKAANTVIT